MADDSQTTVAGALLISASILNTNAVLIAVASGIGVEWRSEDLNGLWQREGVLPTLVAPLVPVGERAIRNAVDHLRNEYQQQFGAQVDTGAFDVVRDCAANSLHTAPSTTLVDLATAHQALTSGLDGLLQGAEAQQVAFLKARLLEAVALAFRAALVEDQGAWRQLWSWLIEQLADQQHQPAGAPAVLAQLNAQTQAAAALEAVAQVLPALIAELGDVPGLHPTGKTFDPSSFYSTDIGINKGLDPTGGDVNTESTPPPTLSFESYTQNSMPVFISKSIDITGDVLSPNTEQASERGATSGSRGAEAESAVTLVRLDTAVPDQVFLNQVFDVAVAIKLPTSPPLSEADLPQVRSGSAQLVWPEGQGAIALRIAVRAPNCEIQGQSEKRFRLYPNQDSPPFYFQIVPKQAGKISIIVELYQKVTWLGSARISTTAQDMSAGTVQQQLIVHTEPLRKTIVPDVTDLQRHVLEKRLKLQTDEYQAINNQIDGTIDSGQRVVLTNRANGVLQEIQQIDAALKQLDAA